MTRSSPELDYVRVPDPGSGHTIAEETASLILQGIQNIKEPTREQIQRTISEEMDGTVSFTGVDSEGTVISTGGLLLIETGGIKRAAIVNMVVKATKRGLGLGVQMMSKLEDEATGQGVEELFGQPELESFGFYQGLGYMPREETTPFTEGEILVKSLQK